VKLKGESGRGRESHECKTVLDFAVETSERVGHRFVGTEHLLVGMLRVEKSLAAKS
jgi:ATP-dependent Clp protease ATP-binding subunit ClpC